MQELGFDPTLDSATKVALMRNDIAHQSVQALIDDLEHITSTIAVNEQADAARAVLDHHHPPVADALLSDAGRRLQHAARAALAELATGLVVFEPPDGPAPTEVAVAPAPARWESAPSPGPTKATSTARALPTSRWRSILTAAAFTGGIATAGFTVGALLQRLL